MNAEHAADRSNPHALFAPIFACTRHAVLGNNMSGVTVPTMITSMSSGVRPALLDRLARRLRRQIARRHAGIDDVALADAGALHDPLVGRLDHLLEVGVGEHARRHVGGQALDLDTADVQNNPLPGTVRPKYS